MYAKALNVALLCFSALGKAGTWGITFGSDLTAQVLHTRLKFKRLMLRSSPLEIFLRLYRHYENVYILESVEGSKKLARYSFIGFEPKLLVKAKNEAVSFHDKNTGEETCQKVVDPLCAVESVVTSQSVSYEGFRFVGGAVGYISYDAVRRWERLPKMAVDDLDFPDIEMGVFDDGIIFDHESRQAFYYYLHQDRLAEVKSALKEENSDFEDLSYTQPEVNVKKENFEEAVRESKKYVSSGDVFQVVLSKRYRFSLKGDLTGFYRSLRRINPSPYMYFLKFGKHEIVGSSPEMLVRVENRQVETFPIAGTRPRAQNARKNRALAQELLSDPKECAEHVMLVDLARNDVGKISKFGSVRVPEFKRVHGYSHVQHIVSRVVGQLRDQYDSYDALRALFPAGTVSGAPKVRAMEIIEELEPTARGPYAGAVGYFSYNGNADFAITIRTLVSDGGKANIQVGAGVVADSVPEREWVETEHKAQALFKALETSRDDSS